MSKALEYYFVKKGTIEHIIFDKYTIDTSGVVRNVTTGRVISTRKSGKYNIIDVCDARGEQRPLYLGRTIASTFLGPPSYLKHTADHIDRNPENDTLENIRWLCKSGQRDNQDRPEIYKTALIVVRYGDEKTIVEWVDHLKYDEGPHGKKINKGMIKYYAQKKKYGFSYKEYPDLQGEVWKEIIGSENAKGGRWEISNMNRVKYITNFAENVISGERLGMVNGYPRIFINGKQWLCHILVFKTFFPDEYASKKINERILHEDDDKIDFRPHKLRLGTQSENIIDAYNNGCHDDTKTERTRCASYINGVFEKEHESQYAAVRYLKSNGYPKASQGNICLSLSGSRNTAYDRTWKIV